MAMHFISQQFNVGYDLNSLDDTKRYTVSVWNPSSTETLTTHSVCWRENFNVMKVQSERKSITIAFSFISTHFSAADNYGVDNNVRYDYRDDDE